jgi:nuclear protein localization family protein 4
LPEFHAFQVSKQAVELQKLGLLQVDEKNPFVVKIKKSEEKFVKFNKREVDSLENVLLLNNVAIKAYQGPFLTGFPPRNRPISDYTQSMEVLKNILQQRRNMKFVKRVSDFHLLLFLVDYLSLSSDMPVLCEAVRTQNQNAAEGFEHLINAYCGL